jgi:hypothetical protein
MNLPASCRSTRSLVSLLAPHSIVLVIFGDAQQTNDGMMPRRTVNSGVLITWLEEDLCEAMLCLARNISAVSGIARDCNLYALRILEHSKMLEISLLIPSLVTPLNIQSHAILQQFVSLSNCLDESMSLRSS